MKIKMTGTHGNYHPGQIIETDDGEAMMLINAGIAEFAPCDKCAMIKPGIETATRPPKEKAVKFSKRASR